MKLAHVLITILLLCVAHQTQSQDWRLPIAPGHGELSKKRNPGHTSARERFTEFQILDSAYIWILDETASHWTIDAKITDIIYNDHHLPEVYVYQIWNIFNWRKDVRYTLRYDEFDNITNEIEEQWDGNSWENDYQFVYAFDVNQNLTSETFLSWEIDDWIGNSRTLHSYNVNQERISSVDQNWNTDDWYNTSQTLYTYDADHNLVNELTQDWTGNDWIDNTQIINTIDDNHRLLSALEQYWDGFTWINDRLSFYQYDEHQNISSTLIQSWDGLAWEYEYLYTAAYDGSHNQLVSLVQEWNGVEWVNRSEEKYTYEDEKFPQNYVYKVYDETGTNYAYGDSTQYYYHIVTATKEPTNQDENIMVYPNPNSGHFTINCASQPQAISIYATSGEEVYHHFQTIESVPVPIDVSRLVPGIYFIRVMTASNTLMSQIVIQ